MTVFRLIFEQKTLIMMLLKAVELKAKLLKAKSLNTAVCAHFSIKYRLQHLVTLMTNSQEKPINVNTNKA